MLIEIHLSRQSLAGSPHDVPDNGKVLCEGKHEQWQRVWPFQKAEDLQRMSAVLWLSCGLEELFVVVFSPFRNREVSKEVMNKALTALRVGEGAGSGQSLWATGLPESHIPSFKKCLIDVMANVMANVRHESNPFRIPSIHVFRDVEDQLGEVAFDMTLTPKEMSDELTNASFHGITHEFVQPGFVHKAREYFHWLLE